MRGARKQEGEADAKQEREVEEDRRRGPDAEAMQGVERRRVLGDERDEQKVREGDAREPHHEVELVGALGEAGRDEANERRHEDRGEHEDDRLCAKEQREHAVRKLACRDGTAVGFRLGVARHISGVESAFAEDCAKMVRQAKRIGERFVHHARAKHRRDHDVADEAGDARDERPAADAEDLLQHGATRGGLIAGAMLAQIVDGGGTRGACDLVFLKGSQDIPLLGFFGGPDSRLHILVQTALTKDPWPFSAPKTSSARVLGVRLVTLIAAGLA